MKRLNKTSTTVTDATTNTTVGENRVTQHNSNPTMLESTTKNLSSSIVAKVISNSSKTALETSPLVLNFRTEIARLQRKLDKLILRYVKYTDKVFPKKYGYHECSSYELMYISYFDFMLDGLQEIIMDAQDKLVDIHESDINHFSKSTIHKVESMFHSFKVTLRSECNLGLRERNDKKFFRLIERRINGTRKNLLLKPKDVA